VGTTSSEAAFSAPTGDLVATAHASPSDAVGAILEHLAALGLGRWRLTDDLTAVPGPVVALVVPGHPGQWSLHPEAHGGDLPGEMRETLLAAARVIATLLAVEENALRASEHAARAERESATDELTGVANARAWWRTLAREADTCELAGLSAVVAVIDLDDLKPVNDALGHLAGDDLLRAAARALQSAVRPHDTVARVGGDEFGVLVVDGHAPDPATLVERLRAQLDEHGVRASVGAAEFTPGDRINEVYHRADVAMYRAKNASRGRPTATAEP
jgi:diguanylate cyclase (GGDEF)-like protein